MAQKIARERLKNATKKQRIQRDKNKPTKKYITKDEKCGKCD